MKKPTKTTEKLNFKPVKKQSSAQKRAATQQARAERAIIIEQVTRNVEAVMQELVQELRVPAQLARMPNPFTEL